MTRRIAAFLVTIVLGSSLTACGGGSAGPSVPIAPAITLPAGGSTISLSGAAVTATLTISEPGYTGTYSAKSSNTAVATVSPASVQAQARELKAQGSGSATFTVTSVGNGTATITVTDQSGNSSTVSVTVTNAVVTGTGTIN